jgi:hypothetical protein
MTSVTDPGGLLDPAVVVGAPFSGAYTLDPDVADVANTIPTPNGSIYYRLVSPGLTTVAIAGVSFSTPIDFIAVGDDSVKEGGLQDVWHTAILATGFPTPIGAVPVFSDSTLTRLSSDAFFVNQDLFGWTDAQIKLVRAALGPTGFQEETLAIGSITSLVAVPEPSTALLLAGGLCIAAARRRMAR